LSSDHQEASASNSANRPRRGVDYKRAVMQTAFIGGLAAAAAFLIARLVS
jgi:hypothetical protein